MKKRILSLALAVLLLLSLVPCAFAADDDDDELYTFTPELMIYEESNLLGMGYGFSSDETNREIAVGDELWVHYLDTVPADVYVNGAAVYHLKENEAERYCYKVKATGALTVDVRRGDEMLLSRGYTVISSKEMYKKVVKDAFKVLTSPKLSDFFPSISELKDAANSGFPVGNPFLPFAFVAMMSYNFLHAIFSFVRIAK